MGVGLAAVINYCLYHLRLEWPWFVLVNACLLFVFIQVHYILEILKQENNS